MVQFWVLANANQNPDLVTYTDNIRQLEPLASHQVIPLELAVALMDAYRQLRNVLHRQTLTHEVLREADLSEVVSFVRSQWQSVFS